MVASKVTENADATKSGELSYKSEHLMVLVSQYQWIC